MQTESVNMPALDLSDDPAEAERIVPEPLSYALLAPAFERGDDLSSLLVSKSTAYADLHAKYTRLGDEIATMNGRGAHAGTQLDPALQDHLLALRQERAALRVRLEACHVVARRRLADAIDALIAEQERQRNGVLAKAIAPDERIGALEHMRSHFGVLTVRPKMLGIARYLTPRDQRR